MKYLQNKWGIGFMNKIINSNLKQINPKIETWYFWSQVMKNKLYKKSKEEELKALILTYEIKE